ncbi:flagellar biosynthesis protein FlgA [Sulfitobacter pseudonitzschiae]|uniref:Flagellar biosynthesis protein FlgA n=1 Tax=Pseudosulfitobacter pseudonitzschiae TaxID=1402135 RepID=A0A9Q2NQY3_9RHOB|nr:Gfo/Idh/MocA family oxidoreductase [Pseudosulfitobacter pseudonitzschiae]MBM2293497.1 flagellar biosynthesis protein FlgA [Pseudosulfitobacter pseudonitzschiae]MBM2298311.1 flagellar biosynthesis protein FlgA [Pseudosulfitobacter pseudonitzschiae]MBM2303224.1 flagellar biosynthesis protein FlgA [Pseudosulfitobacter pseudonitzschiae]MBM2313008.1 flagellar biosynthesis protein FlgA [Pseudosulfitobacter pseudonitzschiae]MBM2317921.1 flagellar biosynthesis protein FlgA [Pseudosulfitobacter pseu
MNLKSLLAARHDAGRPVRVGLIGAGKFGSMILAQARFIEGYHIVGVADLDVDKARGSFKRTGWDNTQYAAPTMAQAVQTGTTCITDDVADLLACDDIECIIEATGHPLAGTRHALAAIDAGKHVIMVNVEADVLCGAVLANRAAQQGVVYSMAYGDQPAAICELVDWVHACGFELCAAGKGMNFAPPYRYSTPDTVWGYFGWSEEEVAAGDFNPKMYNSFTDGTKAAIEMAAVANATGLDCPEDGLAFHPAGLHDLATVFRPESEGGRLARAGLVDIASSREPDGRVVLNNIQYGMFVTFRAPDEYTRACFQQYGLLTDPTGWYGSMWRPFHLIGLETSVSVLNACLRGEATGSSTRWRGDAVATSKGDFEAGDYLDGEGGFKVWAKAIPASQSHRLNALPIGLAHHIRLKRPIKRDQIVCLDDVEITDDQDIFEMRAAQVAFLEG